ncbi:MAG: hypothetical protein AAGA48_02755 [Myxococcota bacterium]
MTLQFLPWLAMGAPIDDVRAQAMVDALVPVVEAQTERRFVRVPRVGITVRGSLRARLLRPTGLALALQGVAQERLELRRLVEPLVSDALAVYVPYDERIYLVQEAFDELGASFDLAMETLEPLIECVLTHEMIHALQHQYGVELATTSEMRRGQQAIREGHASLVASIYCAAEHGDAVVRLMETVQGIELEASLSPDDDAAVYGWGRRVAETLDAEGLLWSAMAAPAPQWPDLVAAVEPTLPPDWRTASSLGRTMRALDANLEAKSALPVSPTFILTPFFGDRWGLDAMPRALGGFALEAVRETDDVMILAFLLDRRGTAAELVAGRRAAAGRSASSWRGFGTDSGALLRAPRTRLYSRALRDSRVVDALWLKAKTAGDGPYTEAWIATPRRLFAVMASGPRPSPRALFDAVRPMINAMSPRRGAELGLSSLEAWIAAVRQVDDAATREPSWQYRMHEAARLLESGDELGCSKVFGERLVPGTVIDHECHARAAFQCAAAPGDLDLALQAVAQLEVAPANAALTLASQSLEADRPRDARRFLDKIEENPTLALDIATQRLGVAVALRRWREVEELLRRNPILPGAARAAAGAALFERGRRSRGLEVVRAACPDLAGAERRQCVEFVAQHTP